MEPKTRDLVILSLLYWGLRRLLELVIIALRSEEAKEVEIFGAPPPALRPQAPGEETGSQAA